MKKMIGLAAKARFGKDTVASIILRQSNVTAYALADPVKVGCQALFGLTTDEVWNDNTKENEICLWGYSARQFFQLVGTGWMRRHNPEHWLMRAQRAFSTPSSIASSHIKDKLITDFSDPLAPLKIAAQAIFGLNVSQVWSPEQRNKVDEFWNLTPAQMFELLETMALETFPDYFELRSKRPVQFPSKVVPVIEGDVAIIKDIRYENEADFIRDHGGQIWHITRDNAEKVNAHCSEKGILVKDGDAIINNDGTLNELCVKVTEICRKEIPGFTESSFHLE